MRRIERTLYAVALMASIVMLAACQQQEPVPTPAPATPTPESAAAEPAPVAAPTPEPSPPAEAPSAPIPTRALREKETERVRADALGQSAIVACKLLPESRIKARERARRDDLLSRGVDPKAYDAVYRQFYDRVATRYPSAKPEIQVQVCEQARKFARSAFGEDAISATDKL